MRWPRSGVGDRGERRVQLGDLAALLTQREGDVAEARVRPRRVAVNAAVRAGGVELVVDDDRARAEGTMHAGPGVHDGRRVGRHGFEAHGANQPELFIGGAAVVFVAAGHLRRV